jgi:glycosyltransferase involved in cell wall biosynthesis
MKLLTTHELHYLQYENDFFDPLNVTGGEYFDEQLAVFSKVILVARCQKVNSMPNCQQVNNERVEIFPVTDFSGYTGLLGKLTAFLKCRKTVGLADRFWLRSPGFIASMVAFWLKRKNIPFFLHVVGDPAAVAQTKLNWMPKLFIKPLMKFFEFKFQRLVHSSYGAIFVTEKALQKRYHSAIVENDLGVSDVRLPNSIFRKGDRNFSPDVFRLVVVGILLKYKGHRFLLDALAKIKEQRAWELFIIGEGPERSSLEKLAQNLGIEKNIRWPGRLTWGEELFRALDESHLFVLPSLTEGMPRVVLEAMARGLPVIATDVGGVSEIIRAEMICPPQNASAMAELIEKVWNDPVLLHELHEESFRRVYDFRRQRLFELRKSWFDWVKQNPYGNIPWKNFTPGKI